LPSALTIPGFPARILKYEEIRVTIKASNAYVGVIIDFAFIAKGLELFTAKLNLSF
jgi:hypothetical protein